MSAHSSIMSRIDASWLHMEHPTNLMMVSGVIILNKPIDIDRFKATIEARLLQYPRFSQIVENARLPYPFVRWKKYVEFNIDEHIKKVSLPGPIDKEAFTNVLNKLVSTPLDIARPLWQIHVVNNYNDGAALIVRLHHCIADGSALIKCILTCTDMMADAPLVYGKYTEKKSEIQKQAIELKETLRAIAYKPVEIGRYIFDRAATLGFLISVLLMRADPDSIFKGKLNETKTVVWSGDIPLPDIRKISKTMNGTINDILATAVSGALSNYMEENGQDPSGLTIRAAMPVDIRDPNTVDKLGNQFGVVYASMPLGIDDHVQRLQKVRQNLLAIKDSNEPFHTYRVLAMLGLVSRNLTQVAMRILGKKATTVFSNVKGPPIPLFLAGSKINDIVFWVPQSGRLSVGISVLSYNNKLTLGIISDSGIIPNPEKIIEAFHVEINTLLQLVNGDDSPQLD